MPNEKTELHTKGLIITPKDGESVTSTDWDAAAKLRQTLDKISSVPKDIIQRIAHAVQKLPSTNKSETDEQ